MRKPFTRRAALKIGGMGLLGLNLPTLFHAQRAAAATAPPAKAKRVIFLFQWGGPSHVDMFDRKPDAPSGVQPLAGVRSTIPGVEVCEGLERVAGVMDKVTLVRSVTHTMKNHNSAGYYALTGCAPPTDDQRLRDSLDLYPAYGSVVDKLAPGDPRLPTFVSFPHVMSDGSVTPGQHASFLGKGHDPFFFQEDPNDSNFRLPELSLPAHITPERLARRREMQKLIDGQSRLLETSAVARGVADYYERCVALISSPAIRRAFDLSQESDAVRESYGRTTYGQSCLLARRLVEAGVKFVSVYFSNSIGGRSTESGGWDTHGFDNTRMYKIIPKYHLPITDQTLPTLLIDLDERGLLDETLVVWMGEFGRTPKINDNESRDHWPQCYTVLLAGGGVKRGFVYGSSDGQGAYPDEHPVRPDDLSATMYHLLGIDPAAEIRDTVDRPLPISRGKPLLEVIA